jgi:hypothetical protein
MNIMPLQFTPALCLAWGRAFACTSAAGFTKLPPNMNSLVGLLNQPAYIPDTIDFHNDCKPYCYANRSDTFLVACYIPSWARAGVRYLRPGTDLQHLDPSSWYSSFWDHFLAMFPDADPNINQIFDDMLSSLGAEEDSIRAMVDNDQIIVNQSQIRRLIR